VGHGDKWDAWNTWDSWDSWDKWDGESEKETDCMMTLDEICLYEVGTIDFWQGWLDEEAYKQQLHDMSDDDRSLEAFMVFRGRAFDGALRIGWEGDIREGPFVGALPIYESGRLSPVLMAWKQDNNGTTFAASPFPLPWLGVAAMRAWQRDERIGVEAKVRPWLRRTTA